MSGIEPIGFPDIRPTGRIEPVTRYPRRNQEDPPPPHEPREDEDEAGDEPRDDDERPEPQHVDLRG